MAGEHEFKGGNHGFERRKHEFEPIYAVFTINVSSTYKFIPNLWGMRGCNNKEKAPVPKPIKANLKPKPKMEVPGNRQLAGANPIFFTSVDGRFAASAARYRETGGPKIRSWWGWDTPFVKLL